MITISEELIKKTHLSEEELRQTIAVLLFERKILTLFQAATFAKLERIEFELLLAKNKVMINDNIEDLYEDLKTLQNIRDDSNK